jgi:recombination protein RecA
MFGPTEDTTGGRAVKFYASLRIHLRKKAKIIDASKNVMGMGGVLEVVKSKVGAPFRPVEFQVLFNRGIGKFEGLLGYLVNQKILTTSGGWYTLGNRRFRYKELPDLWDSIKEEVMLKHAQVQVPMPVDEAPEETVNVPEPEE